MLSIPRSLLSGRTFLESDSAERDYRKAEGEVQRGKVGQWKTELAVLRNVLSDSFRPMSAIPCGTMNDRC